MPTDIVVAVPAVHLAVEAVVCEGGSDSVGPALAPSLNWLPCILGIRTIMLCHNFLIGKEHTSALRTARRKRRHKKPAINHSTVHRQTRAHTQRESTERERCHSLHLRWQLVVHVVDKRKDLLGQQFFLKRRVGRDLVRVQLQENLLARLSELRGAGPASGRDEWWRRSV
jgi:hypothetical protein